MKAILASRRWQLIPVLAVALLIGVSAVPASAQYYGNNYGYGYPYSSNNYGSSYPYSSYNYGSSYPYNSYNSYGYNQYPYSSYSNYGYPYSYNNYSSSYPYYNNYSSTYPYNYNTYGYNSSCPYSSNSYGYGYGYPYSYSGYPYYNNTSSYYGCTSAYTGGAIAQPTGVVAVLAGSSATVSWTAVPGAISYAILQSANGGAYTTAANSATNTATVAGLILGISYSYEVVAIGPNGTQSLPSSPAAATGGGTTGGTVTTPTGLTLTGKTSTTVSLVWNAVSGASSYRLLQSVNGGSFTIVATGIGTNVVAATNLTPNTIYVFEVVAVDSAGIQTAPSNPLVVTTNP